MNVPMAKKVITHERNIINVCSLSCFFPKPWCHVEGGLRKRKKNSFFSDLYFCWARGPFWYSARWMNLPKTHSVVHDSDTLNGAEFCLFRVHSFYVKSMGRS